ncbi:DUF551 domain-containing protein [Enterobacter hormaechei]|uniref:DUF551 domain-containing protein n=1 Tax=Enterobacter hormaechei TaxID=158836 RepID=UPI0023E3C4DD|nr:DUF551 domain-containing protein [Enterobacter hormaechei]MCE1280851.1 DUF551 domain-containing protein [Enterobacter hormaechei]MCE1380115.1 DUF551 domain-containing protein [Enterobacter hormaechei]MDF3600650.1 DUF551 domain-containing protein [Enterobacter hormaechei]
MAELTKEWLLKTIAELEEERDATPGAVNEDAAMALAAMKLALASLEAKSKLSNFIATQESLGVAFERVLAENIEELYVPSKSTPPAPVSDSLLSELLGIAKRAADEADECAHAEFSDDSMKHSAAIVDWERRAAILQGADRPQNEPQNIPENIPATKFKPVADLYGLTSPTGGETSFTFDAVEARDFIDGGWSCQEYVELGRFQEAMLQNGNSPAQSDCCPEQNYIAPAQDGDSPELPDGWVTCSERMPMDGFDVLCASEFDGPGDWRRKVGYWHRGKWVVYGASWTPTHWMPLPAAPQHK